MLRGPLIHDLRLAQTVDVANPPLRPDVQGWISNVGGRPAIRTFKYAERVDRDQFAGIGEGRRLPYPRDAIAACARDRDHQAPNPHCSCGFYGLRDHNAYGLHRPSVLLEVLFAGRVLIHDSQIGLLAVAERQHVLSARPAPDHRRSWGRRPRNDNPPSGPDAAVRTPMPRAPSDDSGAQRLAIPSGHLETWLTGFGSIGLPPSGLGLVHSGAPPATSLETTL